MILVYRAHYYDRSPVLQCYPDVGLGSLFCINANVVIQVTTEIVDFKLLWT